MRRRTGRKLKKLAAIALAAGMMTGAAVPCWASNPTEATKPSFAGETKSIDSADQTMDQDAVVWATVTDEALKQLKVTLPIRLDFVIYRDKREDAANKNNQFISGDYEILVDGNSEVGVKLEKVKISKASGAKWDLIPSGDVASATDFHKISMSLGGTELKIGDNPISNYTVGVGSGEVLELRGSVNPTANLTTTAAAERAFQVTYTISQYTEPTT